MDYFFGRSKQNVFRVFWCTIMKKLHSCLFKLYFNEIRIILYQNKYLNKFYLCMCLLNNRSLKRSTLFRKCRKHVYVQSQAISLCALFSQNLWQINKKFFSLNSMYVSHYVEFFFRNIHYKIKKKKQNTFCIKHNNKTN